MTDTLSGSINAFGFISSISTSFIFLFLRIFLANLSPKVSKRLYLDFEINSLIDLTNFE